MAVEMTTSASRTQNANFWDLYVAAAKYMYGDNIEVVRKPLVQELLDNISFTMYVESTGQQVTEKTRTVVDITTKEYTNRSLLEVDETLVRIKKNLFTSKENQYMFKMLNGLNWGMGKNIGAKVMWLAMSGGSTVVGGCYDTHKSSSHAFKADFNFSHEHEERIKVPALSHVKATMTSHIIKYEQNYTLRFCIPASYQFPVTYKTRCNRICGCCSNTGCITAAQLLQPLPDFKVERGVASFVQHGILSWMGEGISVDKKVSDTQDSMPPRADGREITNSSLVMGDESEKTDVADYEL